MSSASLASLGERLGPDALTTEPAALAERARDQWARSLLAEARGDRFEGPAAVVLPASTEEVAVVLQWAAETGTPVVPRGGGSGVSGGARPERGWVVMDLSRMERVLEVDDESRAVHVEAGIRGDRLESALQPHGLTVGHYPQSIAISTVGGWIAASSAGQASAGFGAIEDRLLGLTVVLAWGGVMRLKPVPRSAAGPDLRRLLVGSEGTLGVVTEAWLACSPLPASWEWEVFGFPSFEACMAALRNVRRVESGAAVVRGYDEVDATLNFGRAGHAGGCLAIVGFDAGLPGLADRRRAVAEEAMGAGGEGIDPSKGYGAHWWNHRNDAVDLYRRIMGPDRIFGSGVVVDTMEVAGLWSGLPRLYAGVRAALAGRAEAVGCHLSHVYPAGSSLYFTFLIRGADDREVEAAYLAAWEDGIHAALEAGGTMTHHHGVGRLKAAFMPGELGAEGAAVLRRIKAVLDPVGILNPGALLRPEGPAPP